MQCWEREIAERPKLQLLHFHWLLNPLIFIGMHCLPYFLRFYFLLPLIHISYPSTFIWHPLPHYHPHLFTSNWASQGRRRHTKALRKVQEQSVCRLSVTSGLPSCCLGCCCFLSGMKRTEVSSSKQKLGILTKFNRTQKLRKNKSGGDKKCSALVWISFQRRALNWLSYKGWYYQL